MTPPSELAFLVIVHSLLFRAHEIIEGKGKRFPKATTDLAEGQGYCVFEYSTRKGVPISSSWARHLDSDTWPRSYDKSTRAVFRARGFFAYDLSIPLARRLFLAREMAAHKYSFAR